MEKKELTLKFCPHGNFKVTFPHGNFDPHGNFRGQDPELFQFVSEAWETYEIFFIFMKNQHERSDETFPKGAER